MAGKTVNMNNLITNKHLRNLKYLRSKNRHKAYTHRQQAVKKLVISFIDIMFFRVVKDKGFIAEQKLEQKSELRQKLAPGLKLKPKFEKNRWNLFLTYEIIFS